MSAQLVVGIDLVRIRKIAESLSEFGEQFLCRIYTDEEIRYCQSRSLQTALQSLAGRFAAKEAAIKALGLADEALDWRDIEVHRLRNGACLLGLSGAAADAAKALGVGSLSLSLSHDGELAVAIVVGERRIEECG
jgi:holo-[acyl-carrier protein] synthase